MPLYNAPELSRFGPHAYTLPITHAAPPQDAKSSMHPEKPATRPTPTELKSLNLPFRLTNLPIRNHRFPGI